MELDILRAIQSAENPVFDILAKIATVCASSVFLVLLICFVYWAVSREKGEQVMLALIGTLVVNNILKAIIMRPRPIGEPGIRSTEVDSATGSSFPSGHTQNTAATAAGLYGAFRKRRVLFVGILAVLLAVWSRLYVGVHWPSDVLAGAALGVLTSLILYRLTYYNVVEKKTAFAILAIAAVIAALICGQEDMIRTAALACGAAVGVRIEHRFIRFSADGPVWKRTVRFLLGTAIVLGLYLGLKQVFPDAAIWLFVRYLIVTLGITVLCPWIFVKCKL